MLCQNCKTSLPETAKFCTMCGAKVNVTFCPNGHVLEPGETVCRYCPSPADQEATRIFISTTVEKVAEAPKADPDPVHTTIDAPGAPQPPTPSPFAATRIVLPKEEEASGLFGWLVITQGGEKWRDFKITKKKTTIGRSQECDFVLDNSQVSGKHASIRLSEDGLYLTDLDSGNGTLVNDSEVDRHKLEDNDLVTIGDITMKFKAF